jgi:hypothetical protein
MWLGSNCRSRRPNTSARLVHVGLLVLRTDRTMASPRRGDGDVLCKLLLRHFYQDDIHRDERPRPHLPGLTPFLYPTSPGVQLRLRWAAECRSCKPQHVPPQSHILTCHLILSITLTPLLRAYTYALLYTKYPRPSPTLRTGRRRASAIGRPPLGDISIIPLRDRLKRRAGCPRLLQVEGTQSQTSDKRPERPKYDYMYIQSSPVVIAPKAPSPQGAHHKGIESSVSGNTKSEANREEDRYVCTANRPIVP